ncbi:hypothetical protein KKB43_02735 [Patescibacteria group bacterium]|nr:hypothetical protein [Patescibacteria group bacterium]
MSARSELNITAYDWTIDGISVKSNASENWLIKNWTEVDQGLHNITVVGRNFSGGSAWNRWVVNITPVYYPDYEIWITNWSEKNDSLKAIKLAVTFDPKIIRVNYIKPLAETGDIMSLLFGLTMVNNIDNAAGTVNITITAPIPVFTGILPTAYVAKINYSLIDNQPVPMQRFDFNIQIVDWNNTIHQWDYYTFTGPNPPYNAKADNVINTRDVAMVADCLEQSRIDCKKVKMIGGGLVDIGDLVITGQKVGQTFYHKW